MNTPQATSRVSTGVYARICVLGLVVVLVGVAACRPAETEAVAVHAQHEHSAHGRHALATGELSPHSVYQLEGEWWDQSGRARTLESLSGRVQVLSMVYTHCGHTCPQVILDMKRIEAQLAVDEGAPVGFVLISIDPERDTPGRLAHFGATARLDPERWTLLGGPDDRVLELATLLGIRYRRESETDFSHSNVLLVLNGQGEVVFRQDGLGLDPAPLLEAVRGARHPSTSSRSAAASSPPGSRSTSSVRPDRRTRPDS